MKTVYNITTNKLQPIPKVFNGVINYHKLPTTKHNEDGFFDYERTEPNYDFETQKAVLVEYTIDPVTNIATEIWNIVNLTQEEIIARIPIEDRQITPAQGMTLLSQMNLLSTVEGMIQQSNNETLKIFWERSTVWNKFSTPVQMISQQLNIDLDQFFIDAKNISI